MINIKINYIRKMFNIITFEYDEGTSAFSTPQQILH